MAIKKKSSGGGGANWMDTYGDMVTLLLCFFVLLYSMSTISTDKWKALVMSFNPDSIKTPTEIPGGNDGPSADAQPENPDPDLNIEDLLTIKQQEIQEALDNLYEEMIEYKEESGLGDSVEITKGDGYVFISFRDTVFFGGDSWSIKAGGRKVLNSVAKMFTKAKDSIDEVRVMGHTASALGTYSAEWDRQLSSMRAAMATAVLQTKSEVDPARFVAMGFGQWRPVAGNKKEADRKKNRRVEICVTGINLMDELGDSIEQYQTMAGIKLEESPPSGEEAETKQP